MATWNIGTDTGSTFTDLVGISDEGVIRVAKTSSTPPDFEQGVVDALVASGVDPSEVGILHHGTTVVTNMLIERTGAQTGLLCTDGFRDILYIRRGSRKEPYEVNWDPPEPLVPRYNRLPIRERMSAEGEVVHELNEDDVRKAGELLKRRGVGAIAVCFLHSYLNPKHERSAVEILRKVHPEAYVCASSDVLPEPPEFPRTSTTVANAYVGPGLGHYVTKLRGAVEEVGYKGGVRIMHSGGGHMSPETALRLPVRTAVSGPAAGVMAAALIAKSVGRENVVSFDVGGTSADIATVRDGRPTITVEQEVEWGMPIGFPAVDLIAVGAGGGSIAWIDAAGAPHVGPRSAAAVPGPACYQRGGVEPTTTDANVALGRIREAALLGGALTLDPELARRAIIERFAKPLGMELEEAAAGIIRIADENMAHGIRRMTIERGLDPREFSLIAFGGAGPMHAAVIARQLEMREVIVPIHPGTTSALGLLAVDASVDLVETYTKPFSQIDPSDMEARFARMEAEAMELLAEEGYRPNAIFLERYVDMRYIGQIKTLRLLVAEPFDEGTYAEVGGRFHTSFEQEFKYAVPELPIESTALRVNATGARSSRPTLRAGASVEAATDPEAARVGERKVWFDGHSHETPFYRRDLLSPGAQFEGPAMVEEYDSTTLIPPGTRVEVDAMGNLILDIT
jgi:N-methylhydantoinase A